MNLPICRALLAVAIAIGLIGTASGESKTPTIALSIETGGSYLLEGVHYTDPRLLRPKLAEIEGRNPRPNLVLVAKKSEPFAVINQAIALLRQAGVPKFGILIEPNSIGPSFAPAAKSN